MGLFTIKRCLTNARHLAVLLTLAAAAPATAQDFRVLDNITDDAGNRYAVWAMAVSDNHKYVTGQAMSMTTGITGIFVYDLETGEYAVKEGVSEMGSDTRGVSDDGLAVGFNPNAVTLAIDGTMTDLETPAGCESGARRKHRRQRNSRRILRPRDILRTRVHVERRQDDTPAGAFFRRDGLQR